MSALAQVPTDAGRSLEQFRPTPQPMPQGPQLQTPGGVSVVEPSGGHVIRLDQVTFSGNTRLPTPDLLEALGGEAALAKPLDFAGLKVLTERVNDYYRAKGFPFARVFLPAQDIQSGQLLIEVVEGRYGKVSAEAGDEALAAQAQPYLNSLVSGEVIESSALERATLLLNDLPGITATPVMAPGTNPGEGDLSVQVQEDKRVRGGIGLDNHGSRYAGAWRVRGDVAMNHVLAFGDQLNISALTPSPFLLTGNVNYAVPVGTMGWRLQLGHARSRYQLSRGFEGFEGTAVVNSATLVYPILRSQQSNFGFSVAYQDKDLQDKRINATEHKTSRVWPLTFNFDHRDTLGQGGVSYGSLTFASGELQTVTGSKPFRRWTLDVARQQRLSDTWSLYAHMLKQGADSNLDSSEGMSLGGATGVRAYPSGESAGDEGWMLQAEVRMNLGEWAPYAFYDHGRVRIDARPDLVSSPAPDQERAGAGLGVRYAVGAWSLDATMAWRTMGGVSKVETNTDPKPRMWVQTRYAF